MLSSCNIDTVAAVWMHADATWTIWGVWLVHSNQAMDNCHWWCHQSSSERYSLNNARTNQVVAAVHPKQHKDNCDLLTGSSVLQRLAHTGSLQSLNSSTNWGVWLFHANQAMDKCHLLIVSSVFQWAVLFEQQDQSGCCSCPFKTRYGQLHQSSCCSCPFKTRYGQLRRWLGHQCCKDLLTQDHLSLWTVGTNWGVWLVHSNQAMDNCHLLIGSSVLQKLAHTGSLQFLNNSSNWLVSIVQSNQAMDKRNLLTGLWFLQWLPHRQVMFACCSL